MLYHKEGELIARKLAPLILVALVWKAMPAIRYNGFGFFTRILGRKFGAPLTYAGFHRERTFAPGMPRYHTLKRDYFYEQINRRTEIYAVIGAPIEQSLSPAIHNAAFRSLDLNKVLVPFLIPPDSLMPSLDTMPKKLISRIAAHTRYCSLASVTFSLSEPILSIPAAK